MKWIKVFLKRIICETDHNNVCVYVCMCVERGLGGCVDWEGGGMILGVVAVACFEHCINNLAPTATRASTCRSFLAVSQKLLCVPRKLCLLQVYSSFRFSVSMSILLPGVVPKCCQKTHQARTHSQWSISSSQLVIVLAVRAVELQTSYVGFRIVVAMSIDFVTCKSLLDARNKLHVSSNQ